MVWPGGISFLEKSAAFVSATFTRHSPDNLIHGLACRESTLIFVRSA
jgi:hypothetical protein